MNLAEIKKQKSTAVIVIGIIVGILVVLAFIGILSSVVLVSLQQARNHASEAAVRSITMTLQEYAPVYKDTNSTYKGLCADSQALQMLKSASRYSNVDKDETTFTCNAAPQAWAASVPLQTGGYWCVDSSGSRGKIIAANLGSETVCPVAAQ